VQTSSHLVIIFLQNDKATFAATFHFSMMNQRAKTQHQSFSFRSINLHY